VRRLLVLALLAGCGPAPHPPFLPCPIQERQCLTDTFLALEGERGQLWDPWARPPSVGIISTVELKRRLELLDSINRSTEIWSDWSDPLRNLGLLSPTMDVIESDNRWDVENTIAVYWTRNKEVTVVDRSRPLDGIDAVATVAHEFTHAAQDREFGMRFGIERFSTDRELVRVTLTEGEADLYRLLAQVRMEGGYPELYGIDRYFRAWLGDVRAQILTADSPHTHARLALPYPAGGLLMARAWLRGRSPAVNQILLHPPATFVSIMHALEDLPDPGPPVPLCNRRVIPVDQFQVLASDRLGAGLLYAYLARLLGTEGEAWKAALTWRGDQLWSLRDRQSAPVTFWSVHTAGLRDTATGALLAARTEAPRLVGDELLFWSGIGADAALALHAVTNCGR
jgi:hypothetical protein